MEENYLDEMLLLAMDLAKSIRKSEIIDDCRLDGAVLRMAPKLEIALASIDEDTTLEEARTCVYEADEPLEEMYESCCGDELRGYLICPDIYELAYSYEAYGEHWSDEDLNKESKELFYLLQRVMLEHGDMWGENCGGAYAIVREPEEETEDDGI
jgi:hypothetical protein